VIFRARIDSEICLNIAGSGSDLDVDRNWTAVGGRGQAVDADRVPPFQDDVMEVGRDFERMQDYTAGDRLTMSTGRLKVLIRDPGLKSGEQSLRCARAPRSGAGSETRFPTPQISGLAAIRCGRDRGICAFPVGATHQRTLADSHRPRIARSGAAGYMSR
jgi:hypothetical protein